jgi:hypothetical protein
VASVDDLKDSVSREFYALAQAVVRAQGAKKTSASDDAEWENLKGSVTDWLDSGSASFAQGQALQALLKPWHDKVSSWGEVVKDVFPAPPAGEAATSWDKLVDLLPWALLLYAASEFLPRSSRRRA